MKKLFIASWVFLILLINLPYIISYWQNLEWIDKFNQKKFLQVLSYFPNSSIWYYNKANTFYKMWDYKQAISYYLSIKPKNLKQKYFILHNLWNSYYKLWEQFEKDKPEVSLYYRKKAIIFYQQALKIWENKIDSGNLFETKSNLEFVLNKIKNKNNLENQARSNNKNNKDKERKNWNKSWQNNSQQWKKTQENWKQSQKENQNTNSQWWKNKQDKKNEVSIKKQKSENGKQWTEKKKSKFSTNNQKNKNQTSNTQTNSQQKQNNQQQKQLMQYLQQYSEQLQKQQKQLMQYYQKVYHPRNQDPFDQFFENDPFFQWLPGQQEEKDW